MPYQSGNSVKLNATFKDYSGDAVDPDIIRLKLYDSNLTLLDTMTIGAEHRLAVGSYFYIYQLPAQSETAYPTDPITMYSYYYEWYAEIKGSVSLKRAKLDVSFL